MKKYSFIAIASLLAASFTVSAAKAPKVKIMHNGHVIEISQNAFQSHLKHGDDLMVFYNGVWITSSEYQYLTYQDATAEDEEFEGDEDSTEDAEEL
ncbi:MAG: hypothetical protein V1783_09745 [Bacteroidota bacterium]|jgi:hypothetical protein